VLSSWLWLDSTNTAEMASLIKQFSGRKQESDVHKHFRYSADDNKSVCLNTDENGKQCGFRVSGKNSTNLKSHIQHHHADTYEQMKTADEQSKSAKRRRLEEDKGKFYSSMNVI